MIDKGSTTHRALYFDIVFEQVHRWSESNSPNVARESGSTTDSDWHHWVVLARRTARPRAMYKDGSTSRSSSARRRFTNTTNNLLIGAFVTRAALSFFFDGAIDEVAIYNVELRRHGLAHYAAASGGGATEPVTLDGAILRVDPVTGAAFAGNPFAASSDPNKRRIIAYGLRNPFRFDVRPGTNELWVGDVGWNAWEEINRVASIGDAIVENFGWPCYEGSRAPERLRRDEPAYLRGAVPGRRGDHCCRCTPTITARSVVTGDGCPTGGSSTAGIAFYPESGGTFPAAYRGGLFFADYTRNCIWWMAKGADGQPDPATRAVFVSPAAGPVDLEVGPDGALYYVGFNGTVRRVQFSSGNQPPTASADAAPTSGPAPLTVSFDGGNSTDPDTGPLTLTYAWDLDGDGAFDDATGATATWTYSSPATVTARLRVTDPGGLTGTDSVVISASNTPPVPVIDTPATGDDLGGGRGDLLQRVRLGCSGRQRAGESAVVAGDDPPLPVRLSQPCRRVLSGGRERSFFAPDHEYPAHLELTLTATDAQGASASATRELHPETVLLSFATAPNGLQLAVNGTTSTAPFSREVIKGSLNSLSAISPQTLGSTTYQFTGWSRRRRRLAHDHRRRRGHVHRHLRAPWEARRRSSRSRMRRSGRNKPARNFGTQPSLSVRNGTLPELPAVQRPDPERDDDCCQITAIRRGGQHRGWLRVQRRQQLDRDRHHLEQRPTDFGEFAGHGRCGNRWDLG